MLIYVAGTAIVLLVASLVLEKEKAPPPLQEHKFQAPLQSTDVFARFERGSSTREVVNR